MNELERRALDLARGRVLDLGAGVGSHALALQARGVSVTALDALPEAVEIMRSRGVADARLGRWEDLSGDERYDTVLILMNGAGVAGTVGGMTRLLPVLREVLSPGGRILLDSVNLPEVLDAPAEEDGIPLGEDGRYPGELHYQLAYRGVRGDLVPQLFLDSELLERLCREAGLTCAVVAKDEDLYLAVIQRGADLGAAPPAP
jgi:SAM-dependent methyltransferase